MFLEILIIALLILVNGVFAMSELAVVSSRPARLRSLAAEGAPGAATAMRLAENPGRFLSSVQIGITLVGILSGAFSGATLGQRLGGWLAEAGLDPGLAGAAGVGVVVVAITYCSLIVGELVPKQIALRDPEQVARRIAPLMAFVATVAAPVVWVLDTSGKAVLALLGQSAQSESRVTDEEIRALLAEATTAGVLARGEQDMLAAVMRLADRSARGLMTPRRDVDMIAADADQDTVRRMIRDTTRSRLLVHGEDADDVLGVLVVKQAMDLIAEDRPVNPRRLAQKAPVVMDTSPALNVVRAIRESTIHVALVFDEYGHFEGLVTSGDVLEAIIGVVQEEGEEPAFVAREEGGWLVSGWMPVDEFGAALGVPVPRDADFETVAGFVIDAMSRLPQVGESFERDGFRFEVVDLDGRRIDKVLVTRVE